MHHSMDARALLIENAVHVHFTRGLAVAVYLFAFRRQHNHVLRRGFEIIHTARADGKQILLFIIHAQVAESTHSQSSLDHLFAVFYNQFSFFLQQHSIFFLSLVQSDRSGIDHTIVDAALQKAVRFTHQQKRRARDRVHRRSRDVRGQQHIVHL